MEQLKAYIVTKSSSDNSFKVGDIIWLSLNGDLNSATEHGWLTKEEWTTSGTNDFEFEPSNEYVVKVIGDSEIITKIQCK